MCLSASVQNNLNLKSCYAIWLVCRHAVTLAGLVCRLSMFFPIPSLPLSKYFNRYHFALFPIGPQGQQLT